MALNQERVIAPVIRSVYNGTGSTIAKGTIVKRKVAATTQDEIVKAAGTTDVLYGVMMADIADKSYGDCQIGGVGLVLCSGTIAIGAEVGSDANGLGQAPSANDTLFGVAVTAGANTAFCEVEITPGAKAQ
jgi:hypothetical protein